MSVIDMNSRGKKWTIYQTAFVIIIIGIVAFFQFRTYRDPEVTVSSENFKVRNVYKMTIPINEITSADTLSWNEMPTIALRTNGFSFLGVNRGYFKTKEGNAVWLSVKSGISPVIRIITNNGIYYLNHKNPNDTRSNFISLTNYLKNKN